MATGMEQVLACCYYFDFGSYCSFTLSLQNLVCLINPWYAYTEMIIVQSMYMGFPTFGTWLQYCKRVAYGIILWINRAGCKGWYLEGSFAGKCELQKVKVVEA